MSSMPMEEEHVAYGTTDIESSDYEITPPHSTVSSPEYTARVLANHPGVSHAKANLSSSNHLQVHHQSASSSDSSLPSVKEDEEFSLQTVVAEHEMLDPRSPRPAGIPPTTSEDGPVNPVHSAQLQANRPSNIPTHNKHDPMHEDKLDNDSKSCSESASSSSASSSSASASNPANNLNDEDELAHWVPDGMPSSEQLAEGLTTPPSSSSSAASSSSSSSTAVVGATSSEVKSNDTEQDSNECLFDLLAAMYECRHCAINMHRRKKNLRLLSNPTGQHCCVLSALGESMPEMPADILPLIAGYAINDVNRAFLVSPAPSWFHDLIQCYVIKNKSRYELYMSVKDHSAYQQLRKKYLDEIAAIENEANQAQAAQEAQIQVNLVNPQGQEEAVQGLSTPTNASRHNHNSSVPSGAAGPTSPKFKRSTPSKRRWGNIASGCAMSTILENDDVFLLAAQATTTWKATKYVITSERADVSKSSPGYLACLKSNFLGTEYTLYDNGPKPKHKLFKPTKSSSVVANSRRQLGNVSYSHYDKCGGPRRLGVALNHYTSTPTLDKDGASIPGVVNVEYENIRPVWHEDIQAHVLHFHNNRVKEKSVKNFKLVRKDTAVETQHGATVLQFGRVRDRSLFVLDFRYPITPLQAFAISLSSIDCRL